MRIESDFLVIGSGIAGLSYALQAANHGSVAIVTKRDISESATKYALDQVKNKTFKGSVVVFDTKADGVGFSDKNAELGADIVKKVNEVKDKIIKGEIKVIPTYAEAKAAGLVPDNLQATDNQ